MNKFTSLITKTRLSSAAVVSALLASSFTVHAALPAAIGTGLTAIQEDGLDLVDLIWPVVIAMTTAFVLFKLFRRGVSKI